MTFKNPLEITGTFSIVGGPDTGKTSFALSCGVPLPRIKFLSDDPKNYALYADIIKKGIRWESYYNLIELSKGKKEIEFHELVLRIIDTTKPGQFDAIVFDTYTRFAKTFQPMIVKNPGKYKDYWSTMGVIKGSEQWVESFTLESQLLDHMRSLAPMVFILGHTKPDKPDGKDIGKPKSEESRALIQKANMRIFLERNPNGPEPIGIVLKRINKQEIDEDGLFTPINVLPPRLASCTWQNIYNYWNNPVGNRALRPDEMLNEFERSILDGTLTRDQREMFRLMRGGNSEEAEALQLIEQVQSVELDTQEVERIKQVYRDGHNGEEIAVKEIASQLGLTIPQYIKASKK